MKFSTQCRKCKKWIRHNGTIEVIYCPKCKNSVDLFSPHNKHKKLKIIKEL